MPRDTWLAIAGLAVVGIACGQGHGKKSSPADETRVAVLADAAPAAVAAPSVLDAAPVPVPDAAPVELEEERGTGSCKVDADCVVTSYQSGCCVQACNGYAISVRELEKIQKREDCEAFRRSGKPCPPPAPCPVQTYRAVGARCVKGHCTMLKQNLPSP